MNIGAGQNPMEHPGFTINVDVDESLLSRGSALTRHSDYVLVSPGQPLPFRGGVFDEVHAINPYGFNPVSDETRRVMTSSGQLTVSGNMQNNKFAKNSGSAKVDPSSVGLRESASGQGIPPVHDFGEQTLTHQRQSLQTDRHGWKQYDPVPQAPSISSAPVLSPMQPLPPSLPSLLPPPSLSPSSPPPSSSVAPRESLSNFLGGPTSSFARNLQRAFGSGKGLFPDSK